MDWALRNKMKFHPAKCKVLSVTHRKPFLQDILPFTKFYYTMGDEIIDYCDTEKDLGININGTLNWSLHSDLLYDKANRLLGLVKRTCHFISNTNMKRTLYLTLIRIS